MKKILIATPSHRGEPLFAYRDSLKNALSSMMTTNSKSYNIMRHEEVGSSVATNRNKCVDLAISHGSDYIMFIDDDISFGPHDIEDLIAHDKDIVSGVYVAKRFPYYPSIYRLGEDEKYHSVLIPEDEDEGLIEVDGCGAGFLLIKVSVFDSLDKPYFSFIPQAGEVLSEDLYFCRNAISAGYKIYVDTGIRVGHIGTYAYTLKDHFITQSGDVSCRLEVT